MVPHLTIECSSDPSLLTVPLSTVKCSSVPRLPMVPHWTVVHSSAVLLICDPVVQLMIPFSTVGHSSGVLHLQRIISCAVLSPCEHEIRKQYVWSRHCSRSTEFCNEFPYYRFVTNANIRNIEFLVPSWGWGYAETPWLQEKGRQLFTQKMAIQYSESVEIILNKTIVSRPAQQKLKNACSL